MPKTVFKNIKILMKCCENTTRRFILLMTVLTSTNQICSWLSGWGHSKNYHLLFSPSPKLIYICCLWPALFLFLMSFISIHSLQCYFPVLVYEMKCSCPSMLCLASQRNPLAPLRHCFYLVFTTTIYFIYHSLFIQYLNLSFWLVIFACQICPDLL